MSAVLKDFAEAAELGPKRRAIVVWDGAGWHTAGDLVVPEGVHLVKLPAYSPELQPAERIWPIVTEVSQQYVAKSIRCVYLLQQFGSTPPANEDPMKIDIGIPEDQRAQIVEGLSRLLHEKTAWMLRSLLE